MNGKLKHNIVLAINTQEELNFLAEVVEGISIDAIYIDEPYVAFLDNNNAVQLFPLSEIDESYPREFDKPRKFMPWYRKNSNKNDD